MNQRSVFDRESYNDRRRAKTSLYGNYRRHRSRTPLRKERPRYYHSRSRSPEAYQNKIRTKDHIFDITDDSPSRVLSERLKRDNYDRFDDSPDRSHVESRRVYDRFVDIADRNPLSHRSERGKIDRSGDTPDRLDMKRRNKRRSIDRSGDTPDRLDMTRRDKRRSINRYGDIRDRLDTKRRDKCKSIDRFGDTPDRSPAKHRDDRGYFDRFGDIPERSPLSYRDEDETLDRYDDAPDHSSVANDISEHSNLSSEYLTDRRPDRQIYSTYSSEDQYSDNRNQPRDIPLKRESRYGEDYFDEYGAGYKDRYASAFDREQNNTNVPRYPVICKFYDNEGTCNRGDSCKFLHICKYYINDDCKFGTGCKRSHNILDEQPRTILEMYDMIPDNYIPCNFINSKEITDLVKEKLKNLEAKLHRDKTKAKFNKPIFHHSVTNNQTSSFRESSYLDRTSDDKIDHDDRCKKGTDAIILPRSDSIEDETEKPSQSLAEYIPLEINVKAKKKDKNIARKNRKKINKRSKKCGDNTPIECKVDMKPTNPQQCEDVKNVPTVQSTITFETQNPRRKFEVRKTSDHWQISNMCDIWVNLDEADSEILCKMCNSVFQIGEKVAEVKQE